jgi:hypothetical protein
MNPKEPETLETRLEGLTSPVDEPATLWRAALGEHRAASARRSMMQRVAPWAVLAAAILLMVPIALPHLGKQRRKSAQVAAVTTRQPVDVAQMGAQSAGQRWESAGVLESPAREGWGEFAAGRGPLSVAALDAAREQEADAPRLLARRADISLKVPDVREGFLRAERLVSPARGEFVEDSRIAGDGPAAAADLTLRVAAARLPEAMNDLRSLGSVVTENTVGDDVTDQAVDLDARLRNERRVEEELLHLVESRTDAPLADVLKLRESLAEVRESVERLDAQRTNLQRRVDLATILVLLRPAEAAPPAPPPDKGFLGHLSDRSETAWMAGSRRLAESLAWIIEAGVGRLVGLVLFLFAAAIGVRVGRRFARWSMQEPSPRFTA